jgi:hypothetical protein
MPAPLRVFVWWDPSMADFIGKTARVGYSGMNTYIHTCPQSTPSMVDIIQKNTALPFPDR